MNFTTPLAFFLLLLLPLIAYIGWPRLRHRRKRDTLSLVLRTLIVLLLVFGLAGAQSVQSSNRLAVVFLVDVSDSMGRDAQEAQLAYIRESMTAMGTDDQVGIVLFGGNALVEQPISPDLLPGTDFRSTPITGNTDLEEAMLLGLSMFPPDAAARMVILSDGQPTLGSTTRAAELAGAAGVEISYVPFFRETAPEVQVTDVRAPSSVNDGQLFDVTVTIESEVPTPATLRISASGALIYEEQLSLPEGVYNHTITLTAGGTGFRDLQAEVIPAGSSDSFTQNNRLATFSRIVGPPRVLVVATNDDDVRFLIPALTESSIVVERVDPAGIPSTIAELADYQAILLVNVPATQISVQKMLNLQSYVRDLGGGLLAVGGESAFGPGGYYQTPLEETLPVEMQIRDQERLPQLTIAYVIDRSGSMGAISPSGVPAIELAKSAIIRSIDLLQPTDRAAVISFDAVAYAIAEFQPVLDRTVLQRLVGTLRPSGGTDILAGMQFTAERIVNEPSEVKHIILLTDGGASAMGLVGLARNLNETAGVTISVISIGPDNPQFLRDMATAGEGNFHQVLDVQNIPTIFSLETVLASRSYIVEGGFVPNVTATNAILDGITAAPSLYGYVATTPKLTAQTILRTPDAFADPVLAAWQYGLGRAVAFTSDATSRWSADWVTWGQYSRFWSQAVRWTITEGANDALEARVVLENDTARIIVDARDGDGAYLNGLTMEVSLVSPGLEPIRLTLQQTAPGRYEATFVPDTEGAYFMTIVGDGVVGEAQPIRVQQTSGWVLGYSPEYQFVERATAERTLAEIAELTNGRDLSAEPTAVFEHNLTTRSAQTPLWPYLLLAAMLLLPFDVAVRRLIITRSDWARLRAYLFTRRVVIQPSQERITSLMDAKRRARVQTGDVATIDPDSDTPQETPRPHAPTGAPTSTISALKKRREGRSEDRENPVAVGTKSASSASSGAFKPADTPRPAAPQPTPRTAAEIDPDANIGSRLLKKRKGEGDDQS